MNRPITNRPEETGISLTPGFSRVPPHQRLGGRHRLISTRLQPGGWGGDARQGNRFNGFLFVPFESIAFDQLLQFFDETLFLVMRFLVGDVFCHLGHRRV